MLGNLLVFHLVSIRWPSSSCFVFFPQILAGLQISLFVQQVFRVWAGADWQQKSVSGICCHAAPIWHIIEPFISLSINEALLIKHYAHWCTVWINMTKKWWTFLHVKFTHNKQFDVQYSWRSAFFFSWTVTVRHVYKFNWRKQLNQNQFLSLCLLDLILEIFHFHILFI